MHSHGEYNHTQTVDRRIRPHLKVLFRIESEKEKRILVICSHSPSWYIHKHNELPSQYACSLHSFTTSQICYVILHVYVACKTLPSYWLIYLIHFLIYQICPLLENTHLGEPDHPHYKCSTYINITYECAHHCLDQGGLLPASEDLPQCRSPFPPLSFSDMPPLGWGSAL